MEFDDDCLPPPPPSILVNDDCFIPEILTRLPVKSLFRFKTACKKWCWLVENDQKFIDLHHTHSKTRPPCRIFIVVPVTLTKEERKKIRDSDVEITHLPHKQFYITADLLFEDNGTRIKAVVDTVRYVHSRSYDVITKPVNGLFCSIESQVEHVVRIHNISTQQVSPSFRSTLPEEPKYNKYRYESSQYVFGFDPATNEHKLVCVWRVRPRDEVLSCSICEVLTLGRQGSINGWRRINDVPPVDGLMNDSDDSVYVNGVIYWSTSRIHPVCIVAFDLGREKFRTITVPDYILNQFPFLAAHTIPDILRYNGYVHLLEVSGRLAVLIRLNHCVFKMYIYEDGDYKKEEEGTNRAYTSTSFSSNNNERWIEVRSIRLPADLKKKRVMFHTFESSGDKIILTSYDKQGSGKEVGKNNCLSFYCFNWKKDSWTEFEVTGIPSSVPHMRFNSSFATFSESLLPVNN